MLAYVAQRAVEVYGWLAPGEMVRGLALEIPVLATVKPVSVGIALVAAALLFRFKWSVLRTLPVCAALGLSAGLGNLWIT